MPGIHAMLNQWINNFFRQRVISIETRDDLKSRLNRGEYKTINTILSGFIQYMPARYQEKWANLQRQH